MTVPTVHFGCRTQQSLSQASASFPPTPAQPSIPTPSTTPLESSSSPGESSPSSSGSAPSAPRSPCHPCSLFWHWHSFSWPRVIWHIWGLATTLLVLEVGWELLLRCWRGIMLLLDCMYPVRRLWGCLLDPWVIPTLSNLSYFFFKNIYTFSIPYLIPPPLFFTNISCNNNLQ